MRFNIRPFPAVRSNRGSFTPAVKNYHAKMNELRILIGNKKEEIIQAMISGNYKLCFIFKMPESWSDIKKAKNHGMYHRQKPDCDNLLKAFKDTVFYKENRDDCEVPTSNAVKFWGYHDAIVFKEL